VAEPLSDRLPARWALILLGAVVAGSLTGVLTYAESGTWPAALLVALAASGATISALHQVIEK
jgi:hypothetical protein